MGTYEFDAGGGKIVEIEAPTPEKALEAFKTSRVSQGEAAVQGAISGGSMGFSDEITGAAAASGIPSSPLLAGPAGLIRPLVGGAKLAYEGITGKPGDATKTYTEERDKARDLQTRAQEQNPWTYGGAQAVGGVATSLLPAGAVGTGATVLGNVGRGIATGVGLGAVQGAGDAATLADIPKEAAIGGTIGGTIGGVIPAVTGGIRRLITPTANIPANRVAHAQTLQNEGVELTPGQLTGNRRRQFFESEHGGTAAPELIENQQHGFTRAVLRRGGIDADNARPQVIDAAFDRIGGQFDRIAHASEVRLDRPLIRDLFDATATYQNLTAPSQRVPAVNGMINDIVNGLNANGGRLTGEVYQSVRTRLNELARGTSNGDLKEAFRAIQGALDDAVERNLPANLRGDWATARRQYRNMLVIEKAATSAGAGASDGMISPQIMRGALVQQSRRSYARGTGDFNELVHAANVMMPKLPDSGTAGRLKSQGVTQAITGGVGALLGGGASAGGTGGDTGASLGGLGIGGAAGLLLHPTWARATLSNLGRRWLSNQALPGAGRIGASPAAVLREPAMQEYRERRQKED